MAKDMRKALVFGGKVTVLYVVTVGVLSAFISWFGHVLDGLPLTQVLHPLYFWIVGIGLLISFASGTGYMLLLDRRYERLRREHSDLSADYVMSLCRAGLMTRFYAGLAILCFGLVAAICPLRTIYPEVMVLLLGSGFSALYIWMSCRHNYRRLWRGRFDHLYDSIEK
ncbi:MAG: hypothetical protein K2O24_00320 [Muribaculaceae bacterium]|nr:hypothetical protein [Muribaculaceae bacterium]